MRRPIAIALAAATMMAVTAAPGSAAPRRPGPSDPDATESVVHLLRNLQDVSDPELAGGFLFGQQHANWDSKRQQWLVNGWRDWRASHKRLDALNTFPSDIEVATGLYPETSISKPTVYGFNLRLAIRVSKAQQRVYARQVVAAYSTGAVVTMHFPADNPATGGNHDRVSGNAMCHLTNDWTDPPAGAAPTIASFVDDLDRADAFFDEVNRQWRDPDGDGIDERSGTVAIVLRPFHEMTGITHWWAGRFYRPDPTLCNMTAPQAYRTMWRRTVEYLIGDDDPSTEVVEGLDRHEFLFAWSPGRPTLTTEWRKYHPNLRLPGRWQLTDYVDIAGLDVYENSVGAFRRQLIRDIDAMHEFVGSQANAKRDVLALAEFGARDGLAGRSDADWYGHGLLDALVEAGVADRIAYAMTWTNRTDREFWVPVPCFNNSGCPSLTGIDQRFGSEGETTDFGFAGFVANPLTVLQRDLPEWWRMPEPRIEPYDPNPPPDHPGPWFPLLKPR